MHLTIIIVAIIVVNVVAVCISLWLSHRFNPAVPAVIWLVVGSFQFFVIAGTVGHIVGGVNIVFAIADIEKWWKGRRRKRAEKLAGYKAEAIRKKLAEGMA